MLDLFCCSIRSQIFLQENYRYVVLELHFSVYIVLSNYNFKGDFIGGLYNIITTCLFLKEKEAFFDFNSCLCLLCLKPYFIYLFF